MDENLNAALNSLDMLATVTNARREYLAERRQYQNICSLNCIIPPWRTSTSNLLPTKENQNCETTFLYCASRRQSEKFYNRRRSRCLPYDIRRKAFHGGFNNSTRGSGSLHFPIALHQHSSTVERSAHLDNELKTKTEKFPVPVLLFRSKSLEDLSRVRSVGINSEGLQLQKNNCTNCIDFGPSSTTRGTVNLCTNNTNIKKEIDSMSMRIDSMSLCQ